MAMATRLGLPTLFTSFLLACSVNDGTGTLGAGSGNSTAVGGSGSSSLGNGGNASLGEAGGDTANGGSTSGSTVCTEISVALLGNPGQYGGDSDAFMAWLGSASSGIARLDSYTTRQTLTSDFLAPYNVVILLGLADDSKEGPFWTYETGEIAAMQAWVEAGGGLITLSGASGYPTEVDPNNQLISYTGISYATDWIVPTCLNVDTSGNAMCSLCCNQAAPIADFITTDEVIKDLSNSITWVGMHGGRSINIDAATTDAHVAATIVPYAGAVSNVLVGKLVSNGRVLAFTDEWITYTSQWNWTSTDASCTGYLPQDKYQTAQFWYNMIHWAQPDGTCFTIDDDTQEVTLW